MPRYTFLLALLLLVLAAPAGAQDAYVNPVLDRVGAADPHLLKWNGEYYLYVTGDPIVAYRSADLVRWEEVGPVFSGSRAPDAWNQADVWAPEVVYRNGTFYLYYTASRASDDWRVGEMARRIGVAVSDSPRGPFTDIGRPVTPGWGIDGHVFVDPDGGDAYFFYSYLYEPRLPGAGLVVDRMPAPDRLEGRPAHVTRGSEAWEDKDGDPNNGSLRYTNEAPTVLKRHGRYYMMYSGGSWDLPTYALAYAYADTVIPGEGLGGPGWVKVVPPILRSTPLVEAPGHNTVVKAPNNVDDVTAYHARVVPWTGPGDRQTFVDRLYWNRDRMYLAPPSLGLLPSPDRPVFADRFDRAGAPGDGWEAAGTWQVEGGEMGPARAASGRALARTAPLHHYVFEANVRLPDAARGAAGVAAYYADDRNHVDVWLDPARRALVTTGVLAGVPLAEASAPLPEDFRFDAYHQLLVTKDAGSLRVALDGVNVQAHALALGAGRAGLLAREARPRFDGIALTAAFDQAFDDAFDAAGATWEARGGGWMVDEGALHQVAGGAGRYATLKGDAAEHYEFTASVRFRDQESTAATAGVVAAAAGDALVLAGFDRTIWPMARFHVRYVAGGAVREALAVGLPRGFVYDAYHTIRVVKHGDAFTFYLDGREIAATRFAVGTARPGLYTEGVRAAFDDVAMKHVVVPPNPVLDGSFEAERWDEGADAAANPWQLAGGAYVHDCCAHTGVRRLVLPAGGTARQVVTGLAAGRYTLYAFATASRAEAALHAAVGASTVEAGADAAAWRRLQVGIEVADRQPVVITLEGRVREAGGFAAFDDVYLVRE